MFKKYLDQTGIAMAFQVIFAEILDKKIEEPKLFSYTAMRLRQIGEDLEKIKIVKISLLRVKSDYFLFRFFPYQLHADIAICIYKWE
jgi:hypothetical protein